MSQKFENVKKQTSNKGISIMKAIEIFHEAEEKKNNGFGSTSYANCGDAYGGPSMTSKKSFTEMKFVKTKHVQNMILTLKLMKNELPL